MHPKPIGKCHYKHFKISNISLLLKTLHWLPIKQRIDYKIYILTYKTLANQQPTYLYNSLSFPTNSVSTRSSDSLVLSILFVRSSLGKRAFSVIGSRLWNSLPPDTRNSYFFANIPLVQAQITPFQNCVSSLGSFPSPLTVYRNFDSWYSYILCPIDWRLVRLPAMPTSLKLTTFLLSLENYGINPWTIVLDLISARFVGGLRLTPLWCLSIPRKIALNPTGLVWKKVKNALLIPLWFYHKSSTGFDWGPWM